MDEARDSPYISLLRTVEQPRTTVGMTVTGKIITAAVAITSITIGSVYFKECPAQYLIPYYLIISGASGLLILILSNLPCGDGREPPQSPVLIQVFEGLLGVFQLAFFITGNVWVYSIYAPNYTDPSASNYCHHVLYLYAFWITTLVYIMIGVSLLVSCCAFICICAVGSRIPSEPS